MGEELEYEARKRINMEGGIMRQGKAGGGRKEGV